MLGASPLVAPDVTLDVVSLRVSAATGSSGTTAPARCAASMRIVARDSRAATAARLSPTAPATSGRSESTCTWRAISPMCDNVRCSRGHASAVGESTGTCASPRLARLRKREPSSRRCTITREPVISSSSCASPTVGRRISRHTATAKPTLTPSTSDASNMATGGTFTCMRARNESLFSSSAALKRWASAMTESSRATESVATRTATSSSESGSSVGCSSGADAVPAIALSMVLSPKTPLSRAREVASPPARRGAPMLSARAGDGAGSATGGDSNAVCSRNTRSASATRRVPRSVRRAVMAA